MECAIREATSEDCDHLMGLIQEIADYHHLGAEVTINSQVLKADGFGKDPFYKCILAERPVEKGCQKVCIIGYALYFYGYSVNHGRIVYLENLYVVSEFRDKGIGRQLLSKVAEIASGRRLRRDEVCDDGVERSGQGFLHPPGGTRHHRI